MRTRIALFIAALSLSVTAFAQNTLVPQPIQQPTTIGGNPLPQNGQVQTVQTVQAPTSAPTPAPKAAPVVGINSDPQPIPMSMPYNSGLPPGLPSQALPSMQDVQRQMELQQQQMPGSNAQTVPGSLPGKPGTEAKFVPSEVISALPPVQKTQELRAVLRTSVGDITIKLNHIDAPKTVDYFMGLAKGDVDFTDIKTSKPVKRPFYNGLIFHRVVKNTLIQTGDPFGNGRGGSGTTIPDENKPTMKFDRPGMVAMAPMRDSTGTQLVKSSNSSQFFITLREVPEWNGQFTIFGEVEDGMDVVQKIANVKVGPTERPIKRIYLVAVEIIGETK